MQADQLLDLFIRTDRIDDEHLNGRWYNKKVLLVDEFKVSRLTEADLLLQLGIKQIVYFDTVAVVAQHVRQRYLKLAAIFAPTQRWFRWLAVEWCKYS